MAVVHPQLADKETLIRLLRKYEGHTEILARDLHCSSGTIRYWMKRHGIDLEALLDPEISAQEEIKRRKEELVEKNNRRLMEQLLQERAITEALSDAIVSAVQALPEVEVQVPETQDTDFEPEEVVLLFGDCQVGQFTTLEETGGLLEYNMDVFNAELDRLVEQVIINVEKHRSYTSLNRLHVIFLGDIVDGEDIFIGHPFHIEQDVLNQTFYAVDKISQAMLTLAGVFPEVEIYGVYGNHGRIGKKGQAKPYVNWDYLVYKFMEARLAAQPNINFTIPKTWWHIVDVCGWKFLAMHGDTVRTWNCLPYYGLDRADGRYTKLLQSKGISYDYLVIGHHHNPAQIDSVAGEKIINGAWPGGSLYSLQQLNTASRPSQLLFGVTPSEGISWRRKIYLDL